MYILKKADLYKQALALKAGAVLGVGALGYGAYKLHKRHTKGVKVKND
jgi:hypothetical protein